MRRTLLSVCCLFLLTAFPAACSKDTPARKPHGECKDPLVLDLATGLLNGAAPTVGPEAVKAMFPCYTGATKEGELWNYRGGVFFLEHDLYFYTFNDFLEVREKFAGTVEPAVLGAKTAAAARMLGGKPVTIKGWQLFPKEYGCVGLQSRDGTVVQVRVHFRPCVTAEHVYRSQDL